MQNTSSRNVEQRAVEVIGLVQSTTGSHVTPSTHIAAVTDLCATREMTIMLNVAWPARQAAIGTALI